MRIPDFESLLFGTAGSSRILEVPFRDFFLSVFYIGSPRSPRRGLPSRLREYLKRRSEREVYLGNEAVRIMGPKKRGQPCVVTDDCEEGKHLHLQILEILQIF